LTHFCEQHGPTSILCTQVLPFSCPFCYPEPSTPPPEASSSPQESHDQEDHVEGKTRHSAYSLQGDGDEAVVSADGQIASIEDHKYFVRIDSHTEAEKLNRYGTSDEDTCASCSLTVPETVSQRLPEGAPGKPQVGGRGRNGSPVLRSRELVHSCGSSPPDFEDDVHESHYHHYTTSESVQSHSSDASCHTHVITYLTLRGPPNPADYALLRRSSIRTLSCELLPRGLLAGPLSFGDAVAGYTIAYIFRLADPRARGRRRSYALIAMAGKDAGRAFRACPVIWRAFSNIAMAITAAAERFQEEEKRREDGDDDSSKAKGRNYTPVSSFLTGRTVDPDGYPRRAGGIKAKSLAEIVGNDSIFAEIHAQFVALLHQLGAVLGGFPLPEAPLENSPRSCLGAGGQEAQLSPGIPVAVCVILPYAKIV
jgi:hypothetical protein